MRRFSVSVGGLFFLVAARCAPLLLAAMMLCAGCGAGGTVRGGADGRQPTEVVFSIGSEDARVGPVNMKLIVEGRPMFFGPVVSAEPARYTYTSCRIPPGEARLWAMSEIDGEIIEAEKVFAVGLHTWVVVTRVRNLEDEPELRIEVSYESGDVWKRVGRPQE